jgi:hypothetical protein
MPPKSERKAHAECANPLWLFIGTFAVAVFARRTGFVDIAAMQWRIACASYIGKAAKPAGPETALLIRGNNLGEQRKRLISPRRACTNPMVKSCRRRPCRRTAAQNANIHRTACRHSACLDSRPHSAGHFPMPPHPEMPTWLPAKQRALLLRFCAGRCDAKCWSSLCLRI